MTDRRLPLADEALLRMLQAAQMASYLTQISDRLSSSAIAWAKDMYWLQQPCLPGAGRDGNGLNHRTQAADLALAEMLDVRRRLQERLSAMQALAAMRDWIDDGVLQRLRLPASTILARPDVPNALPNNKAKHVHLPFDQAIDAIMAEVLDACAELRDRNASLEAALQRLPELYRA